MNMNSIKNRINIKNISVDAIKMLATIFVTVAVGEAMYRLNLSSQIIIMVYLLAVQVVSTVTSSYIYGILAAILGTFIYDFQITDPRMAFSYTIGLPVVLAIMMLVTIITSTITTRIKARAVTAFKREYRTQQLYEINQKLLVVRSIVAIADLTEEYLIGHLNRPSILYTEDPLKPGSVYSEPPVGADEQTLLLYTGEQKERVREIFQNGGPDAGRKPNGGVGVFNIPVVSKENVLGVIGIACQNKPLSQGELTFVWMLAGQVALALELQLLSDEQTRIVVEAEKEKIRGTLLRSISHDLRTPLTGILGASSIIMEQKDIDSKTVESLVNDIRHHAQWLTRMVENILMITRISGDNLKVKKELEAAEEVISEAVSIVRKRFSGYTFQVHIPDELLLVPMDGTLISQVLINLLENAAKNSPEGSLILVYLEKAGGCARFDIIDNGYGIPEEMIGSLFEVHTALKEKAVDLSRGTGLGLSICKTIAQAHGGMIEGRNRSKRGAKFSLWLPLQEVAKADE